MIEQCSDCKTTIKQGVVIYPDRDGKRTLSDTFKDMAFMNENGRTTAERQEVIWNLYMDSYMLLYALIASAKDQVSWFAKLGNTTEARVWVIDRAKELEEGEKKDDLEGR